MYYHFENLEVWRRSCDLAVRIYRELEGCRDYGLKDQMTRAAVSIPSNIAEGSARNSVPEFMRFLHIAKGSAAELKTQIIIASRIGLIAERVRQGLLAEITEISSMVHGLIKILPTMKKK